MSDKERLSMVRSRQLTTPPRDLDRRRRGGERASRSRTRRSRSRSRDTRYRSRGRVTRSRSRSTPRDRRHRERQRSPSHRLRVQERELSETRRQLRMLEEEVHHKLTPNAMPVPSGSGSKQRDASFRCDYRYSTAAKAWFKHFIIPATWADARLRCSLEGAVLASPTTPEIETEMIHIINNFFSPQSEIFTGIHATFSQGDYHTVEGVPLSEIPIIWAEYEPDNLNDNESCITFNGNGHSADRSCTGTRPYICYRSGNKDEEVNACGTIDPEYRLDNRTNSCYKYHTVPRTFARANFACSAEGGHLAIINSETEATVIREFLAKYPSHSQWDDTFIGFSDWGERGDWRTIHGQKLSEAGYSKFSAGQPNNVTTGEFCGSVFRNGMLNDLWCEKPFPFLCEKNPAYPAVCQAVAESDQEESKKKQQRLVGNRKGAVTEKNYRIFS